MIPKGAAKMIVVTIRCLRRTDRDVVRGQLDTVADILDRQFLEVKDMLPSSTSPPKGARFVAGAALYGDGGIGRH